MTREESIDRLRKISEKTPIRTNGDDLLAITMAIQALSQEPTDRIEYGTDGNAYKLWISNGKEFTQEPCDDSISRQAVLEQIRAEIEQTAKAYHEAIDYGRESGLRIALEIIDKYTNGNDMGYNPYQE